jgi:hypothetical protein
MFSSSAKFERPPLYSVDETGKFSFQPDGSNWVFSASVHIGRSVGTQKVNQQTYPKSFITHYSIFGVPYTGRRSPLSARFARTIAKHDESHVIADFQAGKDVGLGMFGNKDSSSVFGVGVRFAQFNTKSNISLNSDPDWQFLYRYNDYPSLGIYHLKKVAGQPYHSNIAGLIATRNFLGIGPSISWNASAPFIGTAKNGEVTVDWGLNAAILFGRQRTKVQHHTTSLYHSRNLGSYVGQSYRSKATVLSRSTTAHNRMRNVIVPNVGGFAGLSFHVENFKVSAGYRADLFFHAVDGGIDTHKSENVGFYGPFASVSVGIGG